MWLHLQIKIMKYFSSPKVQKWCFVVVMKNLKTAKLWKSDAALKSLGEKSWKVAAKIEEWLQWC